MSQKAQDISEKNRENSTMKKSIHTAGTKSFARNREELRKKDPEKKNPHRTVRYIHTHRHKSDKKILNEHVVELKNTLAERPDLADTIKGTAWKGDALNTVLGADKPVHVHGLGLVSNPNQVFGVSGSRHFQDMHLTSLEDTRNDDILSFRLQMEKFEQHMKNQDAKLLELTEKRDSVGQISTSRNALGVAQTTSKKKRVHGDLHSQHLGTVGQHNNVMSKENFITDMEMQRSTKHAATDKNKESLIHDKNDQPRKESARAEKIKETMVRDEDIQLKKESASVEKNMKSSKGASATKHANQKQRNTTNCLDANSIDLVL